jgi:hypothetical protein
MTKEQLESIRHEVKEGVKDVIGDLYIDREQHYQDHNFVKGVRGGIRAFIWGIKHWIVSLWGTN